MKIKDILAEIQRTGTDRDKTDYSKEKISQKTLRKVRMIPGSKQYGYNVGVGRTKFTQANYLIHLIDVPAKRYIGWLGLKSANWFPIKKSYQVANIAIDDDYRGLGLGQSLYGIALSLLNMIIVADETQTPEARRTWVRMNSIPGVNIRGYTSVHAEDWNNRNNRSEIYDESVDRLIGALLRGDGQVIGKDPDFVYVSFPVGANADQTELQSIKKGIAIYSARHQEEGGTSNGLYAQWVGGQ
jgi:hypothetical protein